MGKVLIKKYPGSIKELQKREVIRDIKEKILTLAINYDKSITGPDTANEEERSYELPDNTIIELDNKSRYPLTEILYKPHLDNKSYMGLHDMAWDSYRKCDPDLQIVSN
jgi:Actin